MNRRVLKKICAVVFFVWFANFFLFLIGTVVLGGSPSITHPPKDGRYYLLEHGHVTEVSRPIYLYSKAHRDSLWITTPLIVIAAIVAWRLEAKESDRRAAASSNKES